MTQATENQTEKHLQIRKYPNRRYYDATRSCHVTLEQLYGLIRDGYEVTIIDSKSEQDITAKVLAQIIIELDSPKLGVFPVPMLHRLLQSNQELVTDFVEKYFNQPLAAFLDSQRNMEQYMRQAMGFSSTPSKAGEWTKLMFGPLNPAFWARGGARGSSAESNAPAPANGAGEPSAGNGAADGNGAASEPAAPPAAAGETGSAEAEMRGQIDGLRQQVAVLRSQMSRKKSSRGQKKRAK